MRETIWKKYVISAVTVCALGVMLHSNTVHAVVSDNEEVQEENYVKQHSWIVGLIGESEQDEKYSGGGSAAQTESSSPSEDTVTRFNAPPKHAGVDNTNHSLFWQKIEEKIFSSSAGDVIEVQNEGYDIIPAMIIQALAGKKVTLILNGWDYEQIVLYGEYITAEKERTYYDYEMLKLLEESSAYKIEEEMTDKSYDKTDEERIEEEEHNKKIMTILQKAEQKRQRKQFVRYAAITIFAFSAIVPIVQVYLKRIRKKRLTDENNADWRKI